MYKDCANILLNKIVVLVINEYFQLMVPLMVFMLFIKHKIIFALEKIPPHIDSDQMS